MRYKTRKKLALLVLIFGLPVYIIMAIYIVSLFERPSLWVEFFVYVALGVVWALPLRSLFRGLGQPDPDA